MMDVNTGVLIVWSGAAMEAQSTGQAEIEPYHFLCYALKFAEVDSDTIKQMAKGNEEEQELKATHDRLVSTFVKRWSIAVPEMSTRLRRELRRKGQNNPQDEKILHRSKELLKAFEEASKIVASEGRDRIDVSDLIDVILSKKEDQISGAMKKMGIPLHPTDKFTVSDQLEKYEGVLLTLKEEVYSDDEDKKRIELDPIVKTFFVYLSSEDNSPRRPCLLIRDGARFGEDILKDVVKLSHTLQSTGLSVGSVQCNALLERMASKNGFRDVSMLEEIVEGHKQCTHFYFDSVHRYLSVPIVGEIFPTLFKNWLKKSDGRFVFETTPDHYNNYFEKQQEWKGMFHIIWAHALLKDNDFNL